jgi:hypothetical protein
MADDLSAAVLGQRVSLDTAKNEAVYDSWACQYSEHVVKWGYDTPEQATQLLRAALSASSRQQARQQHTGLRIVDVGGGAIHSHC